MDNANDDKEREKIKGGYKMMVDPNKMGDRFKFMAFYPSAAGEILEKHPPLGFSDYVPPFLKLKEDSAMEPAATT